MARLYLLHVHKLHILESPPIQPLDRKSVGLKCNDTVDGVITLPSGRTIRKLDNGNTIKYAVVESYHCDFSYSVRFRPDLDGRDR